jgi:hypothetical protein
MQIRYHEKLKASSAAGLQKKWAEMGWENIEGRPREIICLPEFADRSDGGRLISTLNRSLDGRGKNTKPPYHVLTGYL